MPEAMLAVNRVELLHDGEACLSAMLRAIESAQREVLLGMYWFGSDMTGLSFAHALEAKARQGVRVCVTYDAVGSFEADSAMFERMRAAGCGVYEYNPVRLFGKRFSFARLNRRNHEKLLLIDGRLGFTGGVNLADPWAPESAGGLGFHDDVVAIEGPAAFAMREIFLRTYRGPQRRQALRDVLPSPLPAGHSVVRVLANDRRRDRHVIEQAYLRRIRSANTRILICNSYFIPSRSLRRALGAAVRRGVRVRVLLSVDSDVPAVLYATHRLYDTMLKRGIEIYEWSRSVLHSKTAVIDDSWCTVGTHNLDPRSRAYNLEVNAVIEDPLVAEQLATRIQHDIDSSVRVDAHAWSFRPLGVRLLEVFFYLFRRVL